MSEHDDFLDDYIAFKLCCEDDDDDSSDGCYIATAVYGTYDCPELWVLRRFRDYGLRKSIIGTAFVRFYYAVSPRLVRRLPYVRGVFCFHPKQQKRTGPSIAEEPALLCISPEYSGSVQPRRKPGHG